MNVFFILRNLNLWINNFFSFEKMVEELRFYCLILDFVGKCIGKYCFLILYIKYSNCFNINIVFMKFIDYIFFFFI